MTEITGCASVDQAEAGSPDAGRVPDAGRDVPVRELLGDDVLDLLLQRSRDEAGPVAVDR